MTNFWESSVWTILIECFIIGVAILVGNSLRRKIPFIRKTLLPTSVISGLLLLILKSVWPWFDSLIDVDFMSVVTYHALALGFIAIALKDTNKAKGAAKTPTIINTGIVTVNSYIIQGIVGLVITIVMATFITGLIPAAGLLLPLGFGQGPGQALSWGTVYETQYGFIGGASFGLSIAALGFLVACIAGVIYLNILKRKGLVRKDGFNKETVAAKTEVVSTENELPLSDSIDKFTIQIVLVVFVYFITYLAMAGITFLCDNNYLGNFGVNTVKPLIWGFNFLLGTIFAVGLKKIFDFNKKVKLMTHKYPSNYLLNRISGFFFDVMIVAGIAAIEITDLKSLWLPLIVLGIGGTIVTFVYLKHVSKFLWPGYEYQGMMSMFGMLTGTASTGMILLREIDPNFETPAADNLVYQSLFAIAFGFPVLLLLGYAPRSTALQWICLGILVAMFIVYNAIIYLIRRSQFKAKKKSL